MVAYLDSSLVLRHILNGDMAIAQAFAHESVIASELLEIECRRVLYRCRLQGELDDDRLYTAFTRLDSVLAGINLLSMDEAVKRRSMESFPMTVKTLDALHVATALVWQSRNPDEPISLYSTDAGMNRVAYAVGITVPLLP